MKSDEYVEEIKHTRADIDKTLLSLEERLSPRELLDRAISWSGGARNFSLYLGRTLRDNPVPAALMGISLVWLLLAATNQRALPQLTDREELNRRMQEVDPRLIM